MASVSLRHVHKTYGSGAQSHHALRGVSLELADGEFVALLGPSGSGKSTLLNVIGCILEPDSGRLQLDGETVYDGRWLRRDLRRLRLDKIGFIFQFHNLLPFLDATDNVALVLQLAGRERTAARERAAELLDYLEIGNRRHAMPANLSGGEAQRVAIGRALLAAPHILLMDEPLSSLDAARRDDIMTVIERIRDELKVPILYVSHDRAEVDRLATQIVELGK